MIKAKLTFLFEKPMVKGEIWPITRQSPNRSGIWHNVEFYINDNTDTHFDYWIVFDKIGEKFEETFCKKENTILITGEPPSNNTYNPKFINQFGWIITCHKHINHPNKILSQQAQPWFIDKSYDFLNKYKTPQKSKVLSMVLSTKCKTSLQYDRLKFGLQLKKHFKDKLDWYGRGVRKFADKWQTLEPYKYSVVLENSIVEHYFTEKVNDCFLSYTFPLYHGDTNLGKYYPEGSFQAIDIYNANESIRIIEEIIETPDHYKKSISTMSKSRELYLNKYQLFPMIVDLIKEIETKNRGNNTANNMPLRLKYYGESKRQMIVRRSNYFVNPIKRLKLLNNIQRLHSN